MEKNKNFNPWEGDKIDNEMYSQLHMLVDFEFFFW